MLKLFKFRSILHLAFKWKSISNVWIYLRLSRWFVNWFVKPHKKRIVFFGTSTLLIAIVMGIYFPHFSLSSSSMCGIFACIFRSGKPFLIWTAAGSGNGDHHTPSLMSHRHLTLYSENYDLWQLGFIDNCWRRKKALDSNCQLRGIRNSIRVCVYY